MSEQIDWDRLARYVSGESSAVEAAEVERWTTESSNNRRALETVLSRWRLAGSSTTYDVERAWNRVASQLDRSSRRDDTVIPIATRRVRWTRVAVPIAAALVVAAGVYATVRTPRAGSGAAVASAASTLERRTGVGERRVVDLPDGSRAVLGAASVLRHSTDASGARLVQLEGEAIFTVAHDAAHPFRVEAGGVVAQDIGTEFSVRAYPGEHRVRVAVREGSVSITRHAAPSAAPVVLGSRDVAHIDHDEAPQVTKGVAVDRLFAWQDGELVFENVPLSQVGAELARWYDVEVRFADPLLADRHLTASFRSEPLDEVLRVIGLSLEIRFEQQGRVVTAHAAPRTSAGEAIRPTTSAIATRGGV